MTHVVSMSISEQLVHLHNYVLYMTCTVHVKSHFAKTYNKIDYVKITISS